MDHLFPTGPAPDRAPTRLPLRTVRPLAPVDPLDPGPSFRVGEAERAAACDALAEHFAAGRLDPAELDDRLARAVAARTQADLHVLFADLRPRRTVPTNGPDPAPVGRRASDATVPVLVSVLVMCLLLAGAMLMVLGAYNGALFIAALVGGTATAVAGGCATEVERALRR